MALLVLASLALASTTTPALQARAEAPAAPAAAAAPVLGGPAIAGVCLLSRAVVFATAKVGVAATARLQQLTQQAQAEIDAERAPIEADAKALQAEQATLTPAIREQRTQALAQRLRAVEQKAALRRREIEATREKAMGRIIAAMQPLVAQVYQAHGCGLLLDRTAVIGGNLANDLTPAVVKDLDAKITTISFEREALAAAK